MEQIVYIIFGAAAGGVMVWLLAKTNLEKNYSAKLADSDTKARSSEAIVAELRQQLSAKEAAANSLRAELDNEKGARIETATRLQATQKSFDEQKAVFETMKTEMTNSFNALSSAALKSSNEEFLKLATERLGGIVTETKGKLGEHQNSINSVIKPLQDTLGRYEAQLKTMEESRHKAEGDIQGTLRALQSTHENLQKETANLVTALRRPQVRGRWGEMQLRRVAELSGMSAHFDFTEQISVDGDMGRQRPDMIVHLSVDKDIVVDAKVSLEAYLDAISAATDEERKKHMARHAAQVRTHMMKLAAKDYWSQFPTSPEFVILFIPGESFLSAALDADPSLIEDGWQKKVIIATPATFNALLLVIASGWRQEKVNENVRKIGELGRELYERIGKISEHFNKLGNAIKSVNENYNNVVGSMESRVIPSVRKFKELGVTGAGEIPLIEQIDKTPRALNTDSDG